MQRTISYSTLHATSGEHSPTEKSDVGSGSSRTAVFGRRSLAAADAICALIVILLATLITHGLDGFTRSNPLILGVAAAVAISLTLWWRNAYVVSRSIRWDGNLALVMSSIFGVGLAMIATAWLLELEPARVWQLLVLAGWTLTMTATRFVLARHRDATTAPVKVIVAGNTGDALATRLALRADPRTAYEVQGFVMDRLDDEVPEIVSQLALGSIDQLHHVVKRSDADLVVVCLGAIDAERFAPMVRHLNVLGVDVALSTGLSNVALRRVSLGHVSGRPLVRVTPAPISGWHLATKRALDVAGASLALIAAMPIMLLAVLAIRIEDGGAAIFRQTRVGKGGFPFTIYKFRTMVLDAETMQLDLTSDHEGPVFKLRADPRVTRVGAFLRKTSIDELPQLFNILRGEMSLVGPRPLPVREVAAAPASFLDRQAVKPGLTGRWQVSGRSDTGFEELDELDRWYVDNWSLGQDFQILARTVPAVLMARGAR
ncbi:MAG: exopolysaccharide biosynthesis polyprenyl glycosylphosphotransferase [Verrucomicrobiales bacterium]|jgi:exopolysaccharide biosynthesis polyprenyl glycosylphosphotransferase